MDSMQDSQPAKPSVSNMSVILLCCSISIFLSSLFYLSYHLANTNKGTIAIPAGKTYLGPPAVVPEWTDFSKPKETPAPAQMSPFTAPDTSVWKQWKGTAFPYQFSYPDTLPLTGFSNDQNDSVGYAWGGRKAAENILINVIDLSKNTTFEPYITKPKKEFVNAWWKQFSGLTGVSPIVGFTNKKGLKGYKARFINAAGQTPNLDIFFEIPGNKNLIIRIANGLMDPLLFDTIVETVEWKK